MVSGRFSLLLAATLCASRLAVGSDTEAPVPEEKSRTVALHADAAALERALLDAMQALSRGDAAAMRADLDGMETSCRRAGREEPIPREIYQFDLAFHATLDRARELAGAGDIEKASQQFCWIQNACRKCHDTARKVAPLR